MLIPKQNRKPFKGKKAFIKSLVCAAQGMHGVQCCEGLDEAHYKTGSYAGKNLKNDRYTVPLCRIHHSTEGNLGETRFWKGKPIGALAEDLHEAYEKNDLDAAFLVISRFMRMG